MIPQDFIQDVQQKTNIVDLISSYIPLKRAGRNFKALCPFHGEKTASFLVSPQKQIFHCFGCGEGGGAIQFLMLYDKLTFVEAVESLAKRLGMPIPCVHSGGKERLKSVLYDVISQAAEFFHNNLIALPQTRGVIDYLSRRGITKEIINTFRLGYALGGNSLLIHMRKRGFTLEMLEKASLIVAKQDGGYADFFRQRIIFPISDARDRVVGFGARIVNAQTKSSKYINSLENPLYSKREHLFGLNFSKDEIVKKDCVIVSEGYLDMITPYAAGIRHVVASLGTALTLEQIRLIKRYTNNVILTFDADKAGQNATLRAVDLSLESGLNITVMQMPQGFDADLAVRQKGVKFVEDLLSKRVDFFDYKMAVLKKNHDINSIEGKVKIANDMLVTISKLDSEVEKYEYIKKLSYLIRSREEVLIAELRKIDKSRSFSSPPPSGGKGEDPVPLVEKILIRLLFSGGSFFTAIKKELGSEDFIHPLSRKTFSFMIKRDGVSSPLDCKKILGSIDDGQISRFVSHVLMEDLGKTDSDVLKDCLAKIKANRVKISKNKIKSQIEDAEKAKDMGRVKELMNQFRMLNPNSEVKND
ncbi:MAG: DNA primase [Candidatus Omnitrophota bacterium]